MTFPHHHLLGIETLAASDITTLLSLSENMLEETNSSLLKGAVVINLFFENSTRTRTSFEMAAKQLGAEVVNMQVETSSIKKGETLLDMAMTLNAMRPDFIVVRHGQSGAVELLSRKVNCPVINAGDGSHEHPTQALLDALTIQRKKGNIADQRVAICGDILHSRVARSNMQLLTRMGADVHIIAPPTLMPPNPEALGVTAHYSMEEGLKDCDVVMMLRIQKERMQRHYIPSFGEFFRFYGLTRPALSHAKEDAVVMHPGPMNRGIEIDSDIADDINRSVILEQVSMGVAVRKAVFAALNNHRPTH